jgi:hypothetical protein
MKKGTKIILIIVGVLILIGLAYYFLVYKPSQSLEKSGKGTPSGSASSTTAGGCVPYTQAQQDADMQKCATECSKLPFMKQAACMIACNNNKKPVKSC